jgi:hypothetical protein
MTYSQTGLSEPRKTPIQNIEKILDAFAKGVDEDGIDRVVERETALQALTYVLCSNFAAAESSAKDDVFSLSFKVTFDRNEFPTTIKAVASCSRISKADIELICPAINED